MGFKLLFIIQCIIFCNQYNLISGQSSRAAREGEFPFVVAIKKVSNIDEQAEKDHLCSGVLVSDKDVITIGRCFDECDLTTIEFVVGSINYRAGVRHYPLWWITFHQWAIMKNRPILYENNEIAIVRLTQPVSSAIPSVRLSTSQNPQLYTSNVITAGWGELMIGMVPRIMRTAILYPLTNGECQEKVNRIYGGLAFHVYNNYICTNGDHQDEWHLIDFGGPLLFNGELIGINQETHPFPTDPPHPEKINLHIRIDIYSEFIYDAKNDL